MIKSIKKTVNKDKLTVVVEYAKRNFPKNQPMEVMTTTDLLKIIRTEYPVMKTIKAPTHRVSNDLRFDAKLVGEWIFEIYVRQEQQPVATPAAQKPKRTRKKSIRKRMSSIANRDRTQEE